MKHSEVSATSGPPCGPLLRCCLLALTLTGPVQASDAGRIGSATIGDLQTLVNEAATASGTAGAQVSVILGDQRADFVYGSANTELNMPMTVDTLVQIGSVTKVVNAALVMTLVDDGTLALDTPVVKYIPELRLSDQEAQTKVTLRQLLSMSSGIDNGPYIEHGRGEDALARHVATAKDIPLNFPPGQGFGYSNTGTCIAGFAAQRATGSSWDALLRQRIFKPAGLAHAETLAEELPYYRVSVGHAPPANGQPAAVVRPWYVNRAQGPAGSTLAMSARDLASFGELFVNGGKAASGNRVLSEDAVRAMVTPTTDVPMAVPQWGVGNKWGLGPNMSKWEDTVVWGHAGGNRSGMSQLIWMPQKRAVLAFTVNVPAALEPFTARMFDGFSHAVFGVRAPKPPAPDSSATVADPKRFVGIYERFEARFEISERAGGLYYREHRVPAGLAAEVTIEGDLASLGGDRFLLKAASYPSGLPRAFFGRDDQGRATNLVDPMRAARRVK